MKKHLFLVLFVFLTVTGLTLAQEKPDTTKSKECAEEKSGCCDSTVEKTAEVPTTPWNTVCPVMGNKVNPKVKLEVYNGKAYGFCCTGCDAKFAKDPEKYSKNLNETGTRFIGKK